MSKELKFEFNDYIIAIDEPYENDCGYVTIGKKDTKDNINIWFKSLNQQTVDFYIELQKYIADLEAKLVESEKQRQHLKDWLDDEILTSVDHESYNATINEYEEELAELKQQLAEKEKEIEKLNAMINTLPAHDKELEEIHNQDKISFALEQLEKVKEWIHEHRVIPFFEERYIVYVKSLNNEIDNQIEELTHQHEDKGE